jgi:dual-specificity kinase
VVQDGHYIIRLGESLIPRYKILKIIGEGTFGKVTQCWDREKKKYVAVKIIKSIQKYRDAAQVEIEILKDIHRRDVNKTRCLRPPLESWLCEPLEQSMRSSTCWQGAESKTSEGGGEGG